jgi:hypothetical protein
VTASADEPSTSNNATSTRPNGRAVAAADHATADSTPPSGGANGSKEGNAAPGASRENSRPRSGGQKRFFSDMNPESTFLNRSTSVDESNRRPPHEEIGVWVDKREYDALVRQKDGNANRDYTFTISQGMHPEQRPHAAVLGPLIEVYFRKFHPIIPLLDEAEFREQYDSEYNFPETLVHAMCLVAAKDSEAEPHLKYGSSPSTLPPREFCSRMHAAVTGALRTPVRFDKITLIQILALASLHVEGVDGSEEASMLLSQAMHYAQTLGLHLGQHASPPQGPEALNKRLFWCLWALDRMNSVVNGRPIIMNDIDIAIEPYAPEESGFPAFEAWLKVTELLNKIIGFYRPHVPPDLTGWEDHFPGLEEIYDEVKAWQLPQSVLATIHLFYLATAILSHRSRGVKQIPRGTHSSIRQRLCAHEVVKLLESDHCRDLHALPFIPYAVSLALSVSYQHLRQSQMHHQQEDARKDFRRCTQLLQNLRRIWCSADTMTALALKVLEGLDKTTSLASFRVPRNIPGEDVHEPPCPQDMSGARSGLLEALPNGDGDATSGDGTQTSAAGPSEGTLPPGAEAGQLDLFDGMDDIFGTYLDPNYPVNLDDISFDNLPPFDWNQVQPQGESLWNPR